ncbi:fructose-bisphosphate aldolase [Candidatus Woesearchaeota archaeon]|nr:MAG: fructose-bisphosphate aldolase [Candidatus Woesearchaeota archaeon]
MINLNKIRQNGKFLFLAYDQGLEHGPRDFNLKNYDPNYILDIALESRYTGVILGHGLAEKYYQDFYKDIPLIIKLNGKTSLPKIQPISRQLCSVERAIKLGASAVGYTVYDGSPKEPEIFSEFGKIVETAHDYGLPVIAWMYPRGDDIKDDMATDLLAYSARIGLELGADVIKIKYNRDMEGFKWVVKNAGRAKIVLSGGDKLSGKEFLKVVQEVLDCGGSGVAVGRNIWQSDKPFALSRALRRVVVEGKKPEEVFDLLDSGQK